MSKKVLRLLSILFLSSILVLSCSNADKTGSGDNNSGNGGSSTGDGGTGTGGSGSGTGDGGTGDGGTTPQGIAKYAGTWTATFDEGLTSYDIIISNDGTVTIKDISEIKAENVQGSGNKYSMDVKHNSNSDPFVVTITFESDNSGTIDDGLIGVGTISKIINE